MGDGITVTIGERWNASREVLFNGIIQDVHIFAENGTKQAIVMAKTSSIRMDRERRSRSFQDTRMTYAQIIDRVLAGYGGNAFGEKASLKTGIPVVQYEETDWQFLKRMAGSAGQAVFCDETAPEPYYKLGLSKTGKKAIFPEDSYRCMVDESYYHVGKEQGLPRTEFLYYQVESTDNHAIGDHAWYKGRTYYIYEKQAEWKGGVLSLCYKLGGESHFRGKKEYNRKLAGLALPGQVVKAEGEKVYLKLDIDGKDGKAAYPYPWSPATGNLLYALPQPGTKAYLHFPDCHEERAYAGSSMHAGNSFPGSPQQRVLGTEHGKQIQLYEDSIALAGGRETGCQLLSLGRENCVLKVCDGGLSATAAGGVALRAPYISIRTPLEINQLKSSRLAAGKEKDLKKKGSRNPATGGDASFSMQYEFSGMASQGVLRGSVYEEYLPFDDAPAYEIEYSMAAKILAGVAVALLVGAVVAAVAFVAAPIIIGATGIAATAIQIAGVVGGLAAATGSAATVYTAMHDDGIKAIGEYIRNSSIATATAGAATLSVFAIAPAAAEVMTAMAIPLGGTGVTVLNRWFIPGSIVDEGMSLLALGISGFYSMFQIDDLRLFFTGQKELGVETGDPVYDGAKDFSTLMMGELTDLSAMNPRWSNVNQGGGDPGDITQIASYKSSEEEEVPHYQGQLDRQDQPPLGEYGITGKPNTWQGATSQGTKSWGEIKTNNGTNEENAYEQRIAVGEYDIAGKPNTSQGVTGQGTESRGGITTSNENEIDGREVYERKIAVGESDWDNDRSVTQAVLGSRPVTGRGTGFEGESASQEINIPKNVERKSRKFSPEAKKGYEKAIEALKTGDTRGLNDHPLSGNRSGQRAIDIKGTGKGRGAGRIIYEYGENGEINIIEILTDHNY